MGILKSTYRFLAIDGVHEASIDTDGTIALKMNDVDKVKYEHGNYILDTGSPHFVLLNNDVMRLDVYK